METINQKRNPRRLELFVAVFMTLILATVAGASIAGKTIGSVIATTFFSTGESYTNYDADEGTAKRDRHFSTTLASGTKSFSFGVGILPRYCTGNVTGTVGRTYPVVFDGVGDSAARTFTIALGAGGTANAVVNGTCETEEPVTP